MNTCKDCKFFHGFQCHRYPPSHTDGYPVVVSADFCGEFSPSPALPAKEPEKATLICSKCGLPAKQLDEFHEHPDYMMGDDSCYSAQKRRIAELEVAFLGLPDEP